MNNTFRDDYNRYWTIPLSTLLITYKYWLYSMEKNYTAICPRKNVHFMTILHTNLMHCDLRLFNLVLVNVEELGTVPVRWILMKWNGNTRVNGVDRACGQPVCWLIAGNFSPQRELGSAARQLAVITSHVAPAPRTKCSSVLCRQSCFCRQPTSSSPVEYQVLVTYKPRAVALFLN